MASLDIGTRDGCIAALGNLSTAKADQTLQAPGLHVLPGVIDTHVHFREPGLVHKEDLESGTAAAALGGVTAVFEMPNTDPPTVSADALNDKITRSHARLYADIAFYVGATDGNLDDLPRLERLAGCCGIKVFLGSSTGGLLIDDDSMLLRLLTSGHRRVAVHAEDESRLRSRQSKAEEGGSAAFHPVWRDVQTAFKATERALALADKTRRRLHILHVSTADEIEILKQRRDLATIEVTPQHLTLVDPDCYERLGTLAQLNPPIRGEQHCSALWKAVQDGVVDVIGSDHAPHTLEEKQRRYPTSPSGMPGVQTLVPVMLTHVAEGRLTLERFVDLTSAGPARVFGIACKGRIVVGYDADFTIVDLTHRRTISNDWIRSKCHWTPFAGTQCTGWPIFTIVRGRLVMREGELVAPVGRPIRFGETL
jgi:dihydroorotase